MDPVTGMMIAQGAGQLGGMLMGGYNESRQLKQQQKLQDMQVKGNKQMLEQLAEKERMMLRESAMDQVYGLEKAGLSKSMMMGKGGAGGVTGGSAAAPSGGNADGGAARMMAQTELARTVAEIENIRAQTEKTKEEAKNIGGGIREGIGLDNIAKQFENQFNIDSREDNLNGIKNLAFKLLGEANEANVKGAIAEGTQVEQQNKIKQEAIGAMLQNQATRQGIQLDKARIHEIYETLKQGWDNLEVQREGQAVSKENMEKLTETMLWQAGIQATGNIVNSILDIRKFSIGQKNTMKQHTDKMNKKSYENRTNYGKNGEVTGGSSTTRY